MKHFKLSILLVCFVLIVVLSIACSMSPYHKNQVFAQLERESNWQIFKIRNSRGLQDITTYQTKGIVTDYLEHVMVNEEILVVGSLIDGFSYINLSDLHDPRGKVSSYTRLTTGLDQALFGLSGFATHPVNGRIYAWCGPEIVDVLSLTPISTQAPDFTHSSYGTSPRRRFEITDDGTFWMGTHNLDSEGNREPYEDNGLYAITVGGTGQKTLVIDSPIWDIFKDSTGTLWVATYDGLSKIIDKDHITHFEFPGAGWFVNQTIEFNGTLYVVVKNFYHDPYGQTTKFKLYKSSNDRTKFEFVCDMITGSRDSRSFIYSNTLYFLLGSGLFYLDESSAAIEPAELDLFDKLGLYNQVVIGDTIYSVGNMEGVTIQNPTKTIVLKQVSTAEQLLSDHALTFYVSENNEKVYIGAEHTSGFNYFYQNKFGIIPFFGEVNTVGFFEHEGNMLVQGARSLAFIEDDIANHLIVFPTNGERVTYDPSGYLWAYPNFGSGPKGVIGMLDLNPSSYSVLRSIEPNGNDYFSRSTHASPTDTDLWEFDQHYHFNKVEAIPGTQNVMIAVSEGTGDFSRNPHSLLYSHADGLFKKIPIPDANSEGIMMLAADDEFLYGVARQKLYKFVNNSWVEIMPLQIGNDFRDMVVFDSYIILASGWNQDGPGKGEGIEIVDLNTRESAYYNASTISLPSSEVFALGAQKLDASTYRIWFGTYSGIAYCEINTAKL